MLVDRLAAAEKAADSDSVRGFLDPEASTAFIEGEVARTQNLAGVPLESWHYRFDAVPDVPGSVAAVLEYKIRGGDRLPARRPLVMTLTRHGDLWFVKGFADSPGARTYRGPWDFGPTAATATDTTVVLSHPVDDALRGRVAEQLPAAVTDVARATSGDWQQNVVVWLTSSDAEYSALGGAQGTAAATVSDDMADGQVSGQRIVVSPAAATRLGRDELDVVLRHELVHVATRARTNPGTPIWVTEGFADFVAYRDRGPIEEQSGDLPVDAAFSGPQANRAYASARTVFDFVDDRCGVGSAARFYDLLAGGAVPDAATREVCALDAAEFRQSWHEWTITHAR
ncbi:basic secretory protein-like protein [Smaragdicoccus niigatensis]|uniref:basic secretory protein-like protein n=1 Tax=Smaragdicoccus niigatensis TaxID=359359 RepID=UPI000360D576|nr:basic secretory protein-like protein [Smaragdicoccus niigatensis]